MICAKVIYTLRQSSMLRCGTKSCFLYDRSVDFGVSKSVCLSISSDRSTIETLAKSTENFLGTEWAIISDLIRYRISPGTIYCAAWSSTPSNRSMLDHENAGPIHLKTRCNGSLSLEERSTAFARGHRRPLWNTSRPDPTLIHPRRSNRLVCHL